MGVNVEAARGEAQNAEACAADFVGLSADFTDALQTAKSACEHEPEVGGWGPYGEAQSTAIAKVEAHGLSLAEHIRGTAAEVADTDNEAFSLLP